MPVRDSQVTARWGNRRFCLEARGAARSAALVILGALAVTPAPFARAGEAPQTLSGKIIAAGCSPSKSPIDLRLTSTDDDVAAVSKVVASAYARFSTSSSGSEPCEQLLVDWINANAKSDSLIQAFPSLVFYLEFNPAPLQFPARYQSKAPPFLAGASRSTRRALIAAIEDVLIQHASPTSEAALLLFSELDDPTLANKAKGAVYGALQKFPWLIDDEWASNIVNGLHSFEQDQAKKALSPNARAIVSRFPFQRPYKPSYGFPWLFRLSALTNSAVAARGRRCDPADLGRRLRRHRCHSRHHGPNGQGNRPRQDAKRGHQLSTGDLCRPGAELSRSRPDRENFRELCHGLGHRPERPIAARHSAAPAKYAAAVGRSRARAQRDGAVCAFHRVEVGNSEP